jgi:hypothetical protein
MDVVGELIELYTLHEATAIESDGAVLLKHFNVADRDQLFAIPNYTQAFGLVSACATIVRNLAVRHAEAQVQVYESVRLLRRILDDGEPESKLGVTRRLVEALLRRGWPAALQLLYDEKARILDWRDFFVSYTDRDAQATNQQFRRLIVSSLGVFPKGEDRKLNHLARVISRHLRRYQGLSGFFAEDELRTGERVQEEIDTYCLQAFAFVQLIEPLAFDREPPRNWCLHEYTKFSQNPAIVQLLGDKDRHFFILTDPQLAAIQPARIPAG